MKKFLLGAVLVTAIMITGTHSAQAFSFSAFWNNLFGNSQVNNTDLGASVYGAKTTTTETSRTAAGKENQQTAAAQASAKAEGLGDFSLNTLDATAVASTTATLNGSLSFTALFGIPSQPTQFKYSTTANTIAVQGVQALVLGGTINTVSSTNVPLVNPFQNYSGSFSKNMTGLLPNTNYYYVFCLANPPGNTAVDCGTVKTFKTADAIATNSCVDTAMSTMSPRSYKVNEIAGNGLTTRPVVLTMGSTVQLGEFKIDNIQGTICNMKTIDLVSTNDPKKFLASVKIREVGNGNPIIGTVNASAFTQNNTGYWYASVPVTNFNLGTGQVRTLVIDGTKSTSPTLAGDRFLAMGIKTITHIPGSPSGLPSTPSGTGISAGNSNAYGVNVTGLPIFKAVMVPKY